MHKKIISHAALVASVLFATSASAEFQKGYATMVGSTAVVPFAKAVGDKATSNGRIHAPLLPMKSLWT